MCFGKEWGEENGCADLRNTAMVLAFWKFPAGLQKSEVICDNGLFEWSVVVFELTVLIPTPSSWSSPANHHQPVMNSFMFTNLSALCVLIFIDFFDLGKNLIEALKAWRKQQHERRCGPGVPWVLSRIVIANSQVPILGSYLRSCWQQ